MKFYEAGSERIINSFINDGKYEFVADPDELDLIRWGSDGGAPDIVENKRLAEKAGWKRAEETYEKWLKRQDNKRKAFNYRTFGIKM